MIFRQSWGSYVSRGSGGVPVNDDSIASDHGRVRTWLNGLDHAGDTAVNGRSQGFLYGSEHFPFLHFLFLLDHRFCRRPEMHGQGNDHLVWGWHFLYGEVFGEFLVFSGMNTAFGKSVSRHVSSLCSSCPVPRLGYRRSLSFMVVLLDSSDRAGAINSMGLLKGATPYAGIWFFPMLTPDSTT